MKKIMMILMAAALVALPTMAQNLSSEDQLQTQFQSTSTMTPSGSAYSANPSLNADGTAYSPAQAAQAPASAPSGPRKIAVVTPDDDPTPVGDAVLPLTLIALAFCGVIALRRRRALNR